MTVTAIRHANTTKPLSPDKDRERVLTEKGIAQAHSVRGQLLNAGLGKYDLIFVSPVARVWQTAEIIAGSENRAPFHEIPELYETLILEERTEIEKMWNDLGYAPFRAYIRRYPREHIFIVRMVACALVMINKIIEAAGTIRTIATNRGGTGHDQGILIVGSAVIIPAVMYEMTGVGTSSSTILDLNMEECETVVLDFDMVGTGKPIIQEHIKPVLE